VNVPPQINKVYSSHVTSVFLLMFVLFLIWLDSTGRMKGILTVFNAAPSDTKNVDALTAAAGTNAAGVKTKDANQAAIAAALSKAGFDTQGIKKMMAIGMAESGLATNGPNMVSSVENSAGPFQINLKAHPYVSEAQARDPVTAAKIAYDLSGGGKNFTPWTTYTSGKYKRFLGMF
jgi:hypothetical protein